VQSIVKEGLDSRMGVLNRSLIKDLIQQTFNLKEEEVVVTLMTCRVMVSVQLKLQEAENKIVRYNSNSSNLKDNPIQ
jgi:hypothetical protein